MSNICRIFKECNFDGSVSHEPGWSDQAKLTFWDTCVGEA